MPLYEWIRLNLDYKTRQSTFALFSQARPSYKWCCFKPITAQTGCRGSPYPCTKCYVLIQLAYHCSLIHNKSFLCLSSIEKFEHLIRLACKVLHQLLHHTLLTFYYHYLFSQNCFISLYKLYCVVILIIPV